MYKTASCTKCGAKLNYKTKKPKFCKKCNPYKGVYKQPKANLPQQSKSEREMHKVMAMILPNDEYIIGGYYNWLMSPKNQPMQLDMFFPKLNLAFEFNGRQHYTYNSYMHKTKEAFEYLRACDKLKARLCVEQGINLLTIKYDKDITKGYLIRRLQEEGLLDKLKAITIVDDTYEEDM